MNSSDAQSCSGFHCSTGKCLLENNKVCDGSNDCGDNTDEIFCGEGKKESVFQKRVGQRNVWPKKTGGEFTKELTYCVY